MFILVHNENDGDRHTLFWDVPFSAAEIEKIYALNRQKHGLIEELDFTPTDIPDSVTLAWIEPRGVLQYKELLERV